MGDAEAFQLTSMLRSVVDGGTGRLVRDRGVEGPVAGKTGTTNDGADVWFVGYTPTVVAAVWFGYDTPRPIGRAASGGRLAAPAWTALMNEIYARRPVPAPWPRPSELKAAEIDNTTGYLATAFCPAEVHEIESFIPGTEPTEYCPVR